MEDNDIRALDTDKLYELIMELGDLLDGISHDTTGTVQEAQHVRAIARNELTRRKDLGRVGALRRWLDTLPARVASRNTP